MSVLSKDAVLAVRWSTAERTRALKRIVPQAATGKSLRRCRRQHRYCRRLPRWFVVWFVIAIGLFCQDSYRQVFRWMHRFRKGQTPGRSTLCEARRRVGVAPLHWLAEEVIQLQGTPQTSHAFYASLRLMASDSFEVDVADTPANERAFWATGKRPRTGGLSAGPCAEFVRDRHACLVAVARQAAPSRRSADGPLFAAFSRRKHAAVVGPQLPLLRPGAAGAAAKGPPVGPPEEEHDLHADPPPERRLILGQVVSFAASS